MPTPERPRQRRGRPDRAAASSEPFRPSPLPPDVAEFLRTKEFACLTHPTTDHGTVFLIKAPGREIESVRGTVAIELRHELYRHPAAPVIRIVTVIHDQPDSALALETFINVQDQEQRSDYAALANQDRVHLLFYDEQLQHRLTKAVGSLGRGTILRVLSQADVLRAAIPRERYDFDRAKAEVLRTVKF